jgi:hypothetical protein
MRHTQEHFDALTVDQLKSGRSLEADDLSELRRTVGLICVSGNDFRLLVSRRMRHTRIPAGIEII